METEKYMEKITGKYAQAKIFADDAEDYAKAQIEMICNNEVSDGCIVRIMPDVHPGQAGPIGLTMTVGRRIRSCWALISAAAFYVYSSGKNGWSFRSWIR